MLEEWLELVKQHTCTGGFRKKYSGWYSSYFSDDTTVAQFPVSFLSGGKDE
jgi:hypothetical protein